jgi:hypothetical protein
VTKKDENGEDEDEWASEDEDENEVKLEELMKDLNLNDKPEAQF